LSLIQRCGIGDALAALLTRKGSDDEMGRADETCIHGGGGLDGNELIPQRFVDTAATLAQRLGEHKVRLRRIDRIVSEATGIHDDTVGPQSMTDRLIGGTQCMLQQLQSEQDAKGNGPSATRGFFRKPCGETLLDGADQRRPGKGIRPLPDGVALRHKVGDVQMWVGTTQPMLQRANKAHRGLS